MRNCESVSDESILKLFTFPERGVNNDRADVGIVNGKQIRGSPKQKFFFHNVHVYFYATFVNETQ